MPVFIRGGGGKTPKLQGKTISPSTSEQIVKADDGFDGLLQVTVGAMKLMGKVEIPSLNKYTEITAYEDYDALKSVIVEAGFYAAIAKPTTEKTIEVTFTPYSALYSTVHFAIGLKMSSISNNNYEIAGFCYDELYKVLSMKGEIYARGNTYAGSGVLSVNVSVGSGNLCTATITVLNDNCVFSTSDNYLILISRSR